MSAFLLACGFNGFRQLSSILSVNLENQKSARHVEFENIMKIMHPRLIMQLRECDYLENVSVTWSRLGLTVKKEDQSYLSLVTEFSNTKASTSSVPQVLENHIIVAVTDQDLLLKKHEFETKNLVLKESAREINNIQIDGLSKKSIFNGTHQELFVSYGANFGILSDWLTSEENVEGSPTIRCISTGIVVREMSCGKEHVVLLDEHGCVYSYGGGSKGQLGHNSVESRSSPTIIDALQGLQVTTIFAGGWHSSAISVFGDLYMWGWNESGQLGLSFIKKLISDECCQKIIPEPQCVIFPSEVTISSVSCGSRHTVILTDNGDVFTCGWNGYGQLGMGDTVNRGHFAKLNALHNMSCVRIFAGQWNTFLLCKNKMIQS